MAFTSFADFLRPDNCVLERDQLQNSIIERMTSRPDETVTIPARTCTALTKHISRMWQVAKHQWLDKSLEHTAPVSPPTSWQWPLPDIPHFRCATNAAIPKTVRKPRKVPTIPPSVGCNMNDVIQRWPAEGNTQYWLATSRRDLLLRTERNGLPLGYKRRHCGEEYQSKCVLCSEQVLETARHLF